MNVPAALPQTPLWLPAMDAWVIALIGCAAIVGAVACARREPVSGRRGPYLLRGIGLLALGAILLNPSRPESTTPPAAPSLTVLVDTSRSMSVAESSDPGASDSRLDAVRERWMSSSYLERLKRSADVKLLAFSERLSAVEPSAIKSLQSVGNATRLLDALDAAITALRPATSAQSPSEASNGRILVLSDANDTTGRDAAGLVAIAKARGIRLDFALPTATGAPQAPADIAVIATPRQPLIAAGISTTIDLSIAQHGFAGHPATLTLEQVSPVRRVLAEQRVTLGQDSRIALEVSPQLPAGIERGLHAMECIATVSPMAAEIDTANNTDPFFLQVTDAQVRIALFEGEPSWDSRFFVAALSDDPRFQVTTVHALGRRAGAVADAETIRTRRITPGVAHSSEETGIAPPLTRKALDGFDIVALGKRIEALFPGDAAADLAWFVTERSGSLVLLRGDPVSDSDDPIAIDARRALAPVLPLQFEHTATAPTPLFALPAGTRALGGAASVLDEAPEVEALARVRDISPLCSTWIAGFDAAQGQTAPALITAPVSGGRVLINLASGFWRWQMLPPDRQGWRRALAAFWPQVMVALAMGNDWAPGQDVSLALDRVTARPGEPVTVVVRARGPLAGVLQPVVTLYESASGAESELALAPSPTQGGMWTGSLAAAEVGVLTVTLPASHTTGDALAARIRIRDDGDEMLHTAPDHALAASLAKATGGEVLTLADTERYIEMMESEALAAQTETVIRPAWRTAWIFWVVVCVLAAEWFWRRRIGLA